MEVHLSVMIAMDLIFQRKMEIIIIHGRKFCHAKIAYIDTFYKDIYH